MSLIGFSRIGQIVMPTIVGSHSDFVAYLKYADFQNTSGDINAILDKIDDGGGDLRFSTDESGANQVACEVVEFDKVGESAQVWVGGLTAATGQIIHIWGDNTGSSQPDVTDTFGRNAAWSGFLYVLHFNQTTGNFVDSTGNYTVSEPTDSTATRGVTTPLGVGISTNGNNGISLTHNSAPSVASEYYINQMMHLTGKQAWAPFTQYGPNGGNHEFRFTSASAPNDIRSIWGWSQIALNSDGLDVGNPHRYGFVYSFSQDKVAIYVDGALSASASGVSEDTFKPTTVYLFSDDSALDRGITTDYIAFASARQSVPSDDRILTEDQNLSSTGAWGVTTAVDTGGVIEPTPVSYTLTDNSVDSITLTESVTSTYTLTDNSTDSVDQSIIEDTSVTHSLTDNSTDIVSLIESSEIVFSLSDNSSDKVSVSESQATNYSLSDSSIDAITVTDSISVDYTLIDSSTDAIEGNVVESVVVSYSLTDNSIDVVDLKDLISVDYILVDNSYDFVVNGIIENTPINYSLIDSSTDSLALSEFISIYCNLVDNSKGFTGGESEPIIGLTLELSSDIITLELSSEQEIRELA